MLSRNLAIRSLESARASVKDALNSMASDVDATSAIKVALVAIDMAIKATKEPEVHLIRGVKYGARNDNGQNSEYPDWVEDGS